MKSLHRAGIYEKYVKRLLDLVGSAVFLLLFGWLYAVVAVLVRIKLGKPVLFRQPRPGKDEKIFDLYKFRTMTDARDACGNYLPDEKRLPHYMHSLISSLQQKGKVRTAETYRTAFNSLRKFCNDDRMTLDAITSDMVEAYESSLRARGNTPNTTSFYLRILRAVYNRAVENDIIENRHPFRHVYTGVEKTVKRALPINMIRKIRALDLSRSPRAEFARDMFMLSFFLRGMSFIDMAFLRKSDLSNGYISYRRRKTGQSLKIKWTDDMQRILDRYPENPTPYLLPILTKKGIDERRTYRNTSYNINHQLKKIAVIVNAAIPITLYCARHSWASAARSKGIPLSVISQGMGHDSETTTRIYLTSLETSVVDRANSLIISSI